ncbi:hypothetical protein SHIRM173S_10140 [Streptomyces hirsutus]
MSWTASSVATAVGPASGMTASRAVVPCSFSCGGATVRMPSVSLMRAVAFWRPPRWMRVLTVDDGDERPLKPSPKPGVRSTSRGGALGGGARVRQGYTMSWPGGWRASPRMPMTRSGMSLVTSRR